MPPCATCSGDSLAGSRSLFVRWSLRDLRQRWLSVVAIALVIAIGTGIYAGLNSTGTWRRMSYDASFAALSFRDLRVELGSGTTALSGTLRGALADLEDEGTVVAAQERLVVETQLDASTSEALVLVPGQLIGQDLGTDAADVDRLHLSEGRLPVSGADVVEVVLEQKLADHHGLAVEGEATLAGGAEVRYVGHGMLAEHFWVTGGPAVSLMPGGFAIVYAELADVQRLAGLDGQVNQLVVRLADGVDADEAATRLEQAVEALSGVSATVLSRQDEDGYRLLYDDIEGDQKIYNVLSLLVLLAASLAAFNLIGRIVDAERREIGVQMALGVSPARIAVRPLLVAAEIALAGVVLGLAVGWAISAAVSGVMSSLLPLPEWRDPFQFGVFALAALLGFVVPFFASALPVRRAVRVEPVEAIRTAHVAVQGRAVARLLRVLHVPGNSMAQLPVRNVLRAPRRTLLTALGVGAAIAVLVGVLGMVDSLRTTISHGERELLQDVPERVSVQLDGFRLADSAEVRAVVDSPLVASADPLLQVGGQVRAAGEEESAGLDLIVTVLDIGEAVWTPTIVDGAARSDGSGPPGIVLARKMADDLGVEVGDAIVLRHPSAAAAGFETTETEMVVVGLHPSPLRSLSYMDAGEVATFGLAGVTNAVDVLPAPGVSLDELRRAMFETPGVASAQPVAEITELFGEMLEQVLGFLAIAGAAVLALALLIAFNSTSIAVDERTREHATLFAFGLPVRSVVALIAAESLIVGVASTLVGIGLGYGLVRWMIGSLISETVPELGFVVDLHPMTLLAALLVGVVAVGLTPVLLERRLSRMKIPDALRVME